MPPDSVSWTLHHQRLDKVLWVTSPWAFHILCGPTKGRMAQLSPGDSFLPCADAHTIDSRNFNTLSTHYASATVQSILHSFITVNSCIHSVHSLSTFYVPLLLQEKRTQQRTRLKHPSPRETRVLVRDRRSVNTKRKQTLTYILGNDKYYFKKLKQSKMQRSYGQRGIF